MEVRCLHEKDAPYMLEWMHDPYVTAELKDDFSKYTINNCIDFIRRSKDQKRNLHLAVVNNNDEYMGTVSLKNISDERKDAEFAICLRRCAFGKGYGIYAMKYVLDKGFGEIGLHKIFWYVSSKNERALRFYRKNNFKEYKEKNMFSDYVWFAIEMP